MPRKRKPGTPTPPPIPSDPETQTTSRVNLRQLADHLKLSRTTISLVLNNAPLAQRIAPKTRERVLAAAATLGYRPNWFARSLSGKRSHMIGVIAPDFGDGYDSVLLSGMEQHLLGTEYMHFVSSHLWSQPLLDQRLQTLLERGAEGLLLVNTPLTVPHSLPSVSIGHHESTCATSHVSVDNAHGMRLVVEHLAALGHRRIAALKGHVNSVDTEDRWNGLLTAAREHGIAIPRALTVQLQRLSAEGILGIDEGYIATRKLLDRRRPFTAIACFNDMSACGAINALRDAGLRVPEDVSVIGFDDIAVAQITQPTLTTIRQPLREMGRTAAQMLIREIESQSPPDAVCMQPELVIRRSTAPPPTA